MRFLATLLALTFLGLPLTLGAQGSRTLHALVIGCDYVGTKFQLPSPLRDADRIAKALGAAPIGFEVTLLRNPDRRAFLDAVDRFGETLARQKGVGLFYFSGHGMQHEGENYLMPSGAMPGYREDLPTECVAASRVVTRMAAAGNGTNLLFLDACRDSLPSAMNKGAALPGLVQMSGSGLLIGFAADSGKVALDSGEGSRYTNALLKHLPTPGISVAELLTRVRRDVINDTARKQEPFVYMGLDELFAFVPGAAVGEPKQQETMTPPVTLADRLRAATRERPYVNSLGMEFIPVPGKEGVWMCRTETRVRDFRAYVKNLEAQSGLLIAFVPGNLLAKSKESRFGGYRISRDWFSPALWDQPGFEQNEDHPVVCVSWLEAKGMAESLTHSEKGLIYRLPTDEEWSAAVGSIGKYPWGNAWPPLPGSGNYWDRQAIKNLSESGLELTVVGGDDYDDGSEKTARVASFSENRFGFFDLGGNVWEWCEDSFLAAMNDKDVLRANPDFSGEIDSNEGRRVLRGGSWYDDSEELLRSAARSAEYPSSMDDHIGFRLVVEIGTVASR
jgi:formylglycine-generating enzyme required for sulfatase activity